jgi:uncharacterized damage-inducible protein DinB
MATQATPIQTEAALLISRWKQAGNKLAALADEFSAEAYEAKLAEDVRSVGDVLRHVAFWNRYVAAIARGQKADESTNELPKSEYSTKAKILEALRKSVTDSAIALKESAAKEDAKIAELAVPFLEHTSEHYGQLAVYARLRGIVPPASRS